MCGWVAVSVSYVHIPTCIVAYLITLVLMIEFVAGQFNGSLLSGFMEIVVQITGGTSSAPIIIMVTPGLQSPTKPMGMPVHFRIMYFNQWLLHRDKSRLHF